MVKWVKGKRLKPSIFKIPVKKIKSGWYSDKYFARTRDILIKSNYHPDVLMQVFTRSDGIVCGVDEAIAILRLCATKSRGLTIRALYDGDSMKRDENVMTIEGDYSSFAHLETVYLGILARRSSIATAVKKVVDAAAGRQVLFFPARFDHYSVQTGDGYAAFISGALGVSTDAQASWWGVEGLGTVPHGLIAAYGGDTVRACIEFDKYLPKGVKRIALVDFQNDCVRTSLEVAKALGRRLWGVRLDTASDVRDVSVKSRGKSSSGVCPELVMSVRSALDRDGFKWVKIVISSGFDADKIRRFVKSKVPFDAVGVGSTLFKQKIDFTADIVKVNGRPCAKIGRRYNPNPRLKDVKF